MDALGKIKSKYRKLLRLAVGSANEHEAANAMLKAAKLLQKWHLDEQDLEDDDKKIVSIKVHGIISKGEHSLLTGIARSNGVCAVYRSTRGAEYFQLAGIEVDIQIVQWVYEVSLEKMAEMEAWRFKLERITGPYSKKIYFNFRWTLIRISVLFGWFRPCCQTRNKRNHS